MVIQNIMDNFPDSSSSLENPNDPLISSDYYKVVLYFNSVYLMLIEPRFVI